MERVVYRLNCLALLVALCTLTVFAVRSNCYDFSKNFFVRCAFAQNVGAVASSDTRVNVDAVGLNGDDVAGAIKSVDATVAAEEALKKEIMIKIEKSRDPSIDRMSSLFFTYWQHKSIVDAKNSHGNARPPTEAELKALEDGDTLKPNPESRYVSLGGIVYKSKDDWTIWLNGKRVTPEAIPTQVIDLKVFNDYIEVKWLDDYTNSIFPLRLRAHQRFNMDMRIFLPG